MSAAKASTLLDAVADEADGVETIDEYKAWTRGKIRELIPHKTLGSGYGHLHAGGVALDYLVTVDYPTRHLQGMRNRVGAIDTPILRRWLVTREPQLFEAASPWPDTPPEWLASFRESGMKNAAAHAVYDAERCVGTYHSFHRIPGRLGEKHIEALKELAPLMHKVLCKVIERLRIDTQFAGQLATLSSREMEIAQWVKMGKTNSDIAGLSGLSENTVKHHLTSIFGKLGVETRVQLVQRLAQHEAGLAPGFGTRIV